MSTVTGTPGRYQRPPLRLTWPDDSEYSGLVVRCRRPSLGEALTLQDATPTSRVEELAGVASLLAGELVDEGSGLGPIICEWNLDDHLGRPVPITVAGLRSVDPMLIATISGQLVREVIGVPVPLPPPSSGGDPSLEASIPMDDPSDSPPSTDAPG